MLNLKAMLEMCVVRFNELIAYSLDSLWSTKHQMAANREKTPEEHILDASMGLVSPYFIDRSCNSMILFISTIEF